MAAVMALGGTATASASVTGPDVSSYQHPYGASINWGQVASPGGASFTAIKATQGNWYVNPYYAQDDSAAHAAGLYVAAYDFADPTVSPVAEADYFVQNAGGTAVLDGPLELPPLLDLESSGGLSPAQLVSWTQQWLNEVQRLTGRTPMIYTYPTFWSGSMGNSPAFGNYPLWVADYSGSPAVLPGWGWWTFWQYTDNATVPGMPNAVDMNYFNGSLSRLQALAAAGTNANPQVQGAVYAPSVSGGSVAVSGWAEDPAAPDTALAVTISVDGAPITTMTANAYDANAASAQPAGGADHGFSVSVPEPTASGAHSVCVAAEDAAGTTSTQIGCQSFTVAAPAIGSFDTATLSATTLTLTGWAEDPSAPTQALTVQASVDGSSAGSTLANGSRPDVAAVYPAGGADHGYSISLPVPAVGSHNVCTSAENAAGTVSVPLGCKTVTVSAPQTAQGTGSLPGMPGGTAPVGVLDSATQAAPGVIRVAGWAIDPTTARPLDTLLYLNGTFVGREGAGTLRNDVAAVYPGAGPYHGYVGYLAEPPGTYQVCERALSYPTGALATLLGCKNVSIGAAGPAGAGMPGGHNPVGHFDTLTSPAAGVMRLTGWAIDPDTAGADTVHVYVDGRWTTRSGAGTPRPDVAAVFPGAGVDHGFTITLADTPGTHRVCVYAINLGPGTTNPLLGCKSITIG